MLRPTAAATSRVRSPSKPRAAIWLKAARTISCRRSSFAVGADRALAVGLMQSSLNSLDEERPRPAGPGPIDLIGSSPVTALVPVLQPLVGRCDALLRRCAP